MRSYPTNSPQAAARLVAFTALADGHVCATELEVLNRLSGQAQLDLPPSQLRDLVQHLAEDLMTTAYSQWGTASQLDDSLLHAIMQETTVPEIHRVTFEMCVAVARADFHLTESEENVIAAASRQWSLNSPQADLNAYRTPNVARTHHAH